MIRRVVNIHMESATGYSPVKSNHWSQYKRFHLYATASAESTTKKTKRDHYAEEKGFKKDPNATVVMNETIQLSGMKDDSVVLLKIYQKLPKKHQFDKHSDKLLGSCNFTLDDFVTGEEVAKRIQCGSGFVNVKITKQGNFKDRIATAPPTTTEGNTDPFANSQQPQQQNNSPHMVVPPNHTASQPPSIYQTSDPPPGVYQSHNSQPPGVYQSNNSQPPSHLSGPVPPSYQNFSPNQPPQAYVQPLMNSQQPPANIYQPPPGAYQPDYSQPPPQAYVQPLMGSQPQTVPYNPQLYPPNPMYPNLS